MFVLNVKQQHGDAAQSLALRPRKGDNPRAIAAESRKYGVNLTSLGKLWIRPTHLA